jgi:hypothetical protein
MRTAPTPIHVRLSTDELVRAATVGVHRQAHTLMGGWRQRAGFDQGWGEGWKINCEGACGELAAAKALGIPWEPTFEGHARGEDVGTYQVRTGRSDGRFLIVRDNDSDEDIFILVVGSAPDYRVVGWATGSECKHPEHLTDAGTGRPPAYFVPAHRLHPIHTLRERS